MTIPATPPEPPALGEPITVAEFWANRRGESVRVQVTQIEGVRCIDLRRYQTVSGRLQPTHKGIALAIHKLPLLAAAVTKALHKARELGLVKDEAKP